MVRKLVGLVMALGGQGTGRNDLFLSLTTSRAEYKAGYSLFLADKDTEAKGARLFAQNHVASR